MVTLADIWHDHPAVQGGLDGAITLGIGSAVRGLESRQEGPGEWRIHEEGHEAWLVRGGERVEFIKPFGFQVEAQNHPARYKLMRMGRRAGKTRLAWRLVMEGHGPVGRWSQGNEPFMQRWEGRRWRGILSGKDVVWLARDHKQANMLWLEEVRPKFKGRPGVTVNEVDRYVSLEGHGTLYVRSNENITSVRGVGDRLAGIVTDEAAWYDLEYALKEVLLPALMDNHGWLVAMSTTNAGRDGNEMRPAGPSYFNKLCERQIASQGAREKGLEGKALEEHESVVAAGGYLSEDWAQFHATARDNPRITNEAFQTLRAEYTDDSHSWAQEGEAKLLKGLHGLMFTQWREDLHEQNYTLDQIGNWHWRAGLDDGSASPGSFVLGAFGPREQEHLHAMIRFNGQKDPGKRLPPKDVGRLIGRFMQKYPLPDRIDADEAMWATGDGRAGTRISSAELVQAGIDEVLGERAPKLVKAAKGKGSREARVKLFHQALKFHEVEEEDAQGNKIMVVPAWGRPKFTVHPRCTDFIRSVPALPVDPANANDIDTRADDHDFDAWTGLTFSRPHHAEAPEPKRKFHQHPGISRYTDQNQEGEPWERNYERVLS